jgi:hypothetical protein
MFDLYDKPRQKRQSFIQEYAYVEDYPLYQPAKRKKQEDEQPRGVVEVDLNNGKTTEIS